jgi:hypothetical protein
MRRAGRSGLALALAALCLWLALLPAQSPLVAASERFNRDVAVASAATYVSLRAINAALSAVQEVEVGGSFGVSGNFQPLKWLEPVDDTVEQVSRLIFLVALLNGVLSLSVGPVSAIGFALLAAALLARCGCEASGRAPPLLRRGMAGCGGLGLALAVGLPLAVALGSWAGDWLTAARWAEANAALEQIAAEARALIGEAGSEERGWRETIGAYLGAGGLFWDRSDELLRASLTLSGVYFLRMVVLPAVIFLACLRLMRALLAGGSR